MRNFICIAALCLFPLTAQAGAATADQQYADQADIAPRTLLLDGQNFCRPGVKFQVVQKGKAVIESTQDLLSTEKLIQQRCGDNLAEQITLTVHRP